MKSTLSSGVAAIFCLCFFAAVQVAGADSPLEESMSRMKKAYKQLSTALEAPVDSKKADYLSQVSILKTEAQKAIDLVPQRAESLPPDQKADMIASYKKSMKIFADSIDRLKQQIEAGKWADATASVNVLKKEMQEGHKAYRKKD